MNNFDAFLNNVVTMYGTPELKATREVGTNSVLHMIKTPEIEINVFHYGGGLMREVTILDIKYNKLFKNLPMFYNDGGEEARIIFNALEEYALNTNKSAPLPQSQKQIVLNHAGNLAQTTGARHRHIDAGADYIDSYSVKSPDFILHAYGEYSSCTHIIFYHMDFQAKNNKMGLPEFYNTVNSNDRTFARQVLEVLKQHVR